MITKPINELPLIEEMLDDGTLSDIRFTEQIQIICDAWEDAAFSELPHHSIVRYFNHQLKVIIGILDRNFKSVLDVEPSQPPLRLLALIDHLSFYYEQFFNWSESAPALYHWRMIDRLSNDIRTVQLDLASSSLSPALNHCLSNWLNELLKFDFQVRYSFGTLKYLNEIIKRLSKIKLNATHAEQELASILTQLNFNHLGFLAFRQGQITEQLQNIKSLPAQSEFLQKEKAAIIAYPVATDMVYDDSFPSLKIMMEAWLKEQQWLVDNTYEKGENAKVDCPSQKQPLDLSVAHLACLIRLFLEEKIYLSNNTKKVFQFFAANYQTKRQSAISAGSLSKEFYSIDQHTAARVREMLEKMIKRINRDFFPVVVVISIAILSHLNMR